MPRLPDRFDLWVRRARGCGDAARGVDYVLGALAALPEWHFLNVGTGERPEIAAGEIEGARVLLVFSDAGRVLEMAEERGMGVRGAEPPVISMPAVEAFAGCLENEAMRCAGILINPGEDAAVVSIEQAGSFFKEWRERGGPQASGFWIPNLTSEEEDFWQEKGL